MIQNLKELFNRFKDEATCRQFLIQQRWNGSPVCPYCGCTKIYNIENGKRFKCGNKECYKKFSVTVGTIFEASNIPLTTWFPAMYIITSHKKGLSSVQLAKDLGVTQKTAWFIIHRIRESLKAKNSPLYSGITESDETYMARKYRSDYKGMTPEEIEYHHKKQGARSKGAVLGLLNRDTKQISVIAFDENKGANIKGEIKKQVAPGSMLMTDESFIYRKGLEEYKRQAVIHSQREWVRVTADNLKVHTNGVENFWSVMKRGIYGTYHQISFKHLQRYCDEFSYRYNSRDLKDGQRFELTLTRIEGRLTYKQLIQDGRKQSQKTDKA